MLSLKIPVQIIFFAKTHVKQQVTKLIKSLDTAARTVVCGGTLRGRRSAI